MISDVEGAAEARSVSGPISVLARSRARVRAVGQSGPDSHWIGGDELGTRESTREPAPAGDRPVPAPADQAGRRGAGSATAPRGAPGRKGQGRSPSSGNKGCGPFGIPSVRARVGTYQDHHDRGTCPCPNTLNGFTPRTQQLHWLVVCGDCSGGFSPRVAAVRSTIPHSQWSAIPLGACVGAYSGGVYGPPVAEPIT